jgi:uncharacterized protein involved in exopolysaccharide biosynthesis
MMREAAVSNLLRTFLLALFRQRLVFGSVLLATLAVAAAWSFLPTPVWRARALVQVPQALGDPDGGGLLSSRELHRRVVIQLGADKLYPGLGIEDATDAFGRDLDSQPGESSALRITYDNRSAAAAVQGLQTLITLFGEERSRLSSQARSGTLDQQAELYRAALDQARKRLDTYRAANKVWSGDEERNLLLRQRADTDAELKRTVNDINELDARIRTLKQQMGQVPSTVEATDQGGRYKVVDDAKAKLLDLQLKERELLSKYRDDSQMVVTVREEIERVQAFLTEMNAAVDQRNKPAANETYVDLTRELLRAEAQRNSADSRRAALETQLPELDRRLAEIGAGAGQLHEMEQAVSAGEADLRRIEEARVTKTVEAGQGGSLVVIEPPNAPAAPDHPNPLFTFAVALPLGLLGGLICALLAQSASATFASPPEVERRLGLPVLAVLPLKR